MKNITVILRMSNACNLSCTYCYDKYNRFNNSEVNKKFLREMDNVIKYIKTFNIDKSKRFNLILHGGEPLMLTDEIYEVFLEKIEENIKNIEISIQTNGTLLTEKKMKILKKHNVKIGISLDGSDEYQNKSRVYPNGKNSFYKVKKTIEMLKENNIKFGIIMTISKNNINKEYEIYNFIKENNIYCNIRPAFPTNQNDENKLIMKDDEYIQFFKKIFDIWYYDKDRKVKLKQINEVYEEFIKVLEPCKYKGTCENSVNCFGNFVALDIDGNVYTCNRTYNDEKFYLGNLKDITLDQILEKCNQLYSKRMVSIENSECNQCKMLKFCYGGCPANSQYLYNDYRQPFTYMCTAKKAIYSYIKQKLELEGQIVEYETYRRKQKI